MIGFGRNMGSMVGPVLGGALVALAGPGLVFWVNAVSFALSAVLVWTVRGRFSEERGTPTEHVGLRAGFVYVAHDRILRAVTLAWMVLLLGVGTVIVAELPLAQSFGLGATGYGLLATSWGVGAVIGTLLATRMRERTRSAPRCSWEPSGPQWASAWSACCRGSGRSWGASASPAGPTRCPRSRSRTSRSAGRLTRSAAA